MSELLDLPNEVLYQLLRWLPGPSVCAVGATCTTLRSCAEDDLLWRDLVTTTYGRKPGNSNYYLLLTWKQHYKHKFGIYSDSGQGDPIREKLIKLADWGGVVPMRAMLESLDRGRKKPTHFKAPFTADHNPLRQGATSGNFKVVKLLLEYHDQEASVLANANAFRDVLEAAYRCCCTYSLPQQQRSGYPEQVRPSHPSDRARMKIIRLLAERLAGCTIAPLMLNAALRGLCDQSWTQGVELHLSLYGRNHDLQSLGSGLNRAVEVANIDIVRCIRRQMLELTAAQPQLTNQSTEQQSQAFASAVQCGNLAIVREFIHNTESASIVSRLVNSNSVLAIAAGNDSKEIVEELLKHKADINANSSAVLKAAAKSASLSMVQMLVSRGAEAYPGNIALTDEESPFIKAQRSNNDPQVAEYLRTLPTPQQRQAQRILYGSVGALSFVLVLVLYLTL
eukprot:TRINITY_DN797_c1_g1_i1.p1 TRINITY_DN797_c1_g1~~TRINITY_DN797_c1_g1_i1.p1  ORF type:complete len:451 (-),score=74.55 TRINITY_DN797_c1_g1_i1:1708-3060(-)